ncbi:MAG: hypothetical protein EOM20_18370, partial [Spartobacteria bacterium]|nr:hypothetical protein [Spartobacteria bacterium]
MIACLINPLPIYTEQTMNSWLKQCVLPWCMCLSAGLSAQAGSMRETGTCIRAWQVVGPFEAVGIETRAVDDEANLSPTDVPFVDGKAWKQITAEQDVIDLETPEAFGSVNKVIGYAYAELNVERACDLILGVGSDDAVSAWWNGRRVLVNEVYRGVTVSEDKIILHADKGPNRLLLKIYDEGGGYGFSADVQSADDEPVAWTSVKPLNEDELLDLIEKRSFLFFWNEVNPENGLIADTAPEEGADPSLPCSVASIGFGLTGICIADSRGWISREEALARVITTLETMYNDVENVEGFYYHFITMKDGERQWDCELSSIDTALFLAGALTCRAYFDDPEVRRLADALYARVNWPWMLNGKDTLSMGWSPEHGFIKHHWDTYSEHMVMCLLAIGSPTHPLDPECWHAWSRPTYSYNGMIYLQAVPLFLHQYSHGWVDFR